MTGAARCRPQAEDDSAAGCHHPDELLVRSREHLQVRLRLLWSPEDVATTTRTPRPATARRSSSWSRRLLPPLNRWTPGGASSCLTSEGSVVRNGVNTTRPRVNPQVRENRSTSARESTQHVTRGESFRRMRRQAPTAPARPAVHDHRRRDCVARWSRQTTTRVRGASSRTATAPSRSWYRSAEPLVPRIMTVSARRPLSPNLITQRTSDPFGGSTLPVAAVQAASESVRSVVRIRRSAAWTGSLHSVSDRKLEVVTTERSSTTSSE